jgi:hypothetical protein
MQFWPIGRKTYIVLVASAQLLSHPLVVIICSTVDSHWKVHHLYLSQDYFFASKLAAVLIFNVETTSLE